MQILSSLLPLESQPCSGALGFAWTDSSREGFGPSLSYTQAHTGATFLRHNFPLARELLPKGQESSQAAPPLLTTIRPVTG